MSNSVDTIKLQTAPGLVFDVSVAGSRDKPLVLMLHGFGVSRFSYNAQVSALAAAGFFAAAPNQRGYSAGARPDPSDYANYRIDRLIADALDIAAALGHGERRFHPVGHDWGGSLAWEIADRQPERLGSLTILSRPHPQSFARALIEDAGHKHRSRHHSRFLEPNAVADILANDVKWLRRRLTANTLARHPGALPTPSIQANYGQIRMAGPVAREAAGQNR